MANCHLKMLSGLHLGGVFCEKKIPMTKQSIITLLVFSTLFTAGAQGLPGKFRKIQKYIDQATATKLSGVAVYIEKAKQGNWIGTSGYADLNGKQSLTKEAIFSMGSVGKMYNAVAVFKLAEEGKIQLDDKIAKYLPSEIIEHLPNAKNVTIRHLLGHTSGWEDYDRDPELNRLYLEGRLKLDTLSRINTLRRYCYNKPPLSSPGTKFNYSSTNYLLLAMIVDQVVPDGHTSYLRQLIATHGYTNTYYREKPPEKNVRYYGDLNKDEVIEDLTSQTFETANWFEGDDGVYAPIGEAAHFLQDLMKGKIINQQSLNEMKTGNKGIDVDVALGLATDKSFPYGVLYGHSGRGIGTTADVFYFPKQDITIVIFCNTGLRGAAPSYRKTYLKMRGKIVKKIFLF